MSSFFGRYLRVELPEIGLNYVSNSDKDENGNQAPRIAVTANLQKGAFVQGKVSIYGLKPETRKKMQQQDYTVNIYAGWSNKGNSQIINADKKYFEVIRVGSDIIVNIYFLSKSFNRQKGDTILNDTLQGVIRSQAKKFGYTVDFESNHLFGLTVSNKSLEGNLYKRLDTLKSLYDFEYYEQGGQILIAQEQNSTSEDILDIDASEGLLSIPAFSNVGQKVDFTMMFNPGIRVGGLFRLTNKFIRIAIGDNNKTFASEIVGQSFNNVQDIKFRVLDIIYNLDTRGQEFSMKVEGIK